MSYASFVSRQLLDCARVLASLSSSVNEKALNGLAVVGGDLQRVFVRGLLCTI